MMSSKMVISNYTLYGGTPSEIISKVNMRLCEQDDENMFVTAWLGILEISTGKMICCNAGHQNPVIRRSGGKFEYIDDKHGVFIGMIEEARYTDYEIRLEPGDTLFVYTDVVTEATDSGFELFGQKRMIDVLNSVPGVSMGELLKIVKHNVDAFVGDAPQFDDLTMLTINYK